MKRPPILSDSGQALIQVTLMLVILLGFVGLALDGGLVYAGRRQMQNAADAAALAGARELCLGHSAAEAIAEARTYLLNNGVQAAAIGAGDITVSDNVVDVTARQTAQTFLMGVIGSPTVDIAAAAGAACGGATSACGLWPVAYKVAAWDAMVMDGACSTDKEFLVWNDDKLACDEGKDLCDCYECDIDDTVAGDDIMIMGGGQRGWLDFGMLDDPYPGFNEDCSGGGAASLECHLRSNSGYLIDLPACIPGEPGVMASMQNPVNERVGDFVRIPLFDEFCPAGPPAEFDVVAFGCVEVIGWEQHYELDPNPDYDGPLNLNKRTGKAIRAKMACGQCTSSCGSTTGATPQPGEVTAVSIVR